MKCTLQLEVWQLEILLALIAAEKDNLSRIEVLCGGTERTRRYAVVLENLRKDIQVAWDEHNEAEAEARLQFEEEWRKKFIRSGSPLDCCDD